MKFLSRSVMFCCFVSSGACLAHVDRALSIEADGTITGIPAEYGPAKMQVLFAPHGRRHAIVGVDLELGSNQTHLPACVTGLFNTQVGGKIQATASWYHEESVMPFYLNVKFFDPEYENSRLMNSGYSLFFNLRTGKLMSMEVLILRDGGKIIQNVPVDLRALCTVQEYSDFSGSETRVRDE